MPPKKPKRDAKTGQTPLPTKQDILNFINESETRVGKREIARAFHLRGSDRIWLKAVLKELADEGEVETERRRVAPPGRLPEVAVIEVSRIDMDGEVICIPTIWQDDAPPPTIYLAPSRRVRPEPGVGDRVLARLRKTAAKTYEAQAIRVLGPAIRKLTGRFESTRGGGILRPADRRHKYEYFIPSEHSKGAVSGDYVTAEVMPGGFRQHRARVVERLGPEDDPRSISLVAIHSNDIPTEFSPEALAQADRLKPAELGDRTDLRDVPLVTIDGADARDFDDAVWAEPDPDAANPGGWHLLVAIADVAWYVRPGDALDRAAYERGNSAYFPDRVVPMLPEALSNDLCSLRPGEDRACLAAHLWIDRDGRVRRHRFVRGLMRSAARLTYEQVQNAQDGRPDDSTGPLLKPVLAPLYGAFGALLRARTARGTLELDVPERRIILGADGRVERVVPRTRHDSHRLIEEFMIAANVAAAEALHAAEMPVMYRDHEPPPLEKLEALRESLAALGYSLARGAVVKPRHFTGILEKASRTDQGPLVSQLILRSQSKAVYSPEDLGHFGLALRRYCHFTSPIRRYADLLVHRALISARRLGAGGLPPETGDRFAEIGEHISTTERRAEAAERDAVDRFTTIFLADRIGASFAGRITGVTRFGLFVTLDESGADGLAPVGLLPWDRYVHDELRHSLVGTATGLTFTLGDRVTVELKEADRTTGSLVFTIVEGGRTVKQRTKAKAPGRGKRQSSRKTKRSRGRANEKL